MTKKQEIQFLKHIDEGIYTIDRQGRIWRHKRFSTLGNLLDMKTKRAEVSSGGTGYLNIIVRMGKKSSRKAMAHRLIWAYFHDGNIDDSLEINHLNGIKDDNRPRNLELVTKIQNKQHAHRYGFVAKIYRGEKHANSKLIAKEIKRIRKIHKSGLLDMSELGRMFFVHPSTIKRIVTRKTWKHIT